MSAIGSGKRLLICSPGIPHESHGASTVLFYHYIEKLKRMYFDILNILLLQPDNYTEQDLAKYVAKMTEDGKFEVIPCRASNFTLPKRLSLKLNIPALESVLRRAEAFQPDVILCFDLLSARVAGQIPFGAKLAWLGDLNFQTQWYHAWYATRENLLRVVSLPVTWLRCLVWKKIYKDALREMDSVIVSSKSSERHLRQLGIMSTYQPYAWPDPLLANEIIQGERHRIPSFLFFGTLTGLGSRSAFHFMISAIYPRLLSLWGKNGFQIFISGSRGLPTWVEKALSDKPEFKYLGFVDDIESLMASCHAVLSPIDVPVGNRSRIVTAMAMKVLVIAHENTSLGNPDLVDGLTCYLPNNADRFVECMKTAFDRPKQIETIIENARQCYEKTFRPDVATEMMADELLRTMHKRNMGKSTRPL